MERSVSDVIFHSSSKNKKSNLTWLRQPSVMGLPTICLATLGLVTSFVLPMPAKAAEAPAQEQQATGVQAVQTLQVNVNAAKPVVRDDFTVIAPPPPVIVELPAPAPLAPVVRQRAVAAPAPSSPSPEAAAKAAPAPAPIAPPETSYSGAAVIAFAQQFVGVTPYGSGAHPNDSFSCDGLTQYVFGQFGISLPRMVNNQAALGVRISPAEAQAGDLVVWPGEHIGIYNGNGGVIHSPAPGRKVTHATSLWGSYHFVRLAG